MTSTPRQWKLSGEESRRGNLGSLAPEQVRHYDAAGYLVLPGLLGADDLAPAEAAMTQKVDAIAADLVASGRVPDDLKGRPFDRRLAQLCAPLTDEEFLKYSRSWRDRYPGYFWLMSNPKVLDVVESLIGPEIFANPVYNVRPKVPKVAAGAVPWHQDKSYWPGATSHPVVTVWIALVDATLENGCLHVIPKTQNGDLGSFHAETYSGTGYTELDDAVLEPVRHRALALPVSAGTAIVFNDRFIHSSGPNTSDAVRWSVDLRYQPADQDPMPQYGAGFLARSRQHPERVAGLEDWLASRLEAAPR